MENKKDIDYKDNCFDIIRLIAALQVMFGHLVLHFELNLNSSFFRIAELVSRYVPGKGVIIFFVISGFFAIPSAEKCEYNNSIYYREKKRGGIGRKKFLGYILNYGLHL